ncbi:hypothetical protein [Aeromonas salmonicida]|uniref:hypothetical protein n=1 Tax=Aeromonas salmonicida TaxID=645 RepID=UPI001F46FCF1|nr:hypothetical protein [Aeromonas salmonicida]MCE9932697.1 hypothetical protein [Aeromonas salmonicida]
MAYTLIDKMAIGMAMSYLFCDLEDFNDAFDTYIKLKDSDGELFDELTLWEPVAGKSVEQVIDLVEDMALSNSQTLRQLADAIKAGLVAKAIDCTLDSDFNALDMTAVAEEGYQANS